MCPTFKKSLQAIPNAGAIEKHKKDDIVYVHEMYKGIARRFKHDIEFFEACTLFDFMPNRN